MLYGFGGGLCRRAAAKRLSVPASDGVWWRLSQTTIEEEGEKVIVTAEEERGKGLLAPVLEENEAPFVVGRRVRPSVLCTFATSQDTQSDEERKSWRMQHVGWFGGLRRRL